MFKRIKNLVELSKYRIDTNYKPDKYGMPTPEHKIIDASKPKKKLAVIVEQDPYNPLNEFEDETSK